MRNSLAFLLAACCTVLIPSQGFSQGKDSVVTLSGDGYAFTVSVPSGWVLEAGHGSWSGVRAILFPRAAPRSAKMWGNPDAWISIGIASKQSEGNLTLKNLLAFYAKVDSQETKSAKDLPSLTTKDGAKVLLQRKEGSGSFGAMAFIEDQTIVAVVELRRFDEQEFKSALPRFEEIVKSYHFATGTTKAGK